MFLFEHNSDKQSSDYKGPRLSSGSVIFFGNITLDYCNFTLGVGNYFLLHSKCISICTLGLLPTQNSVRVIFAVRSADHQRSVPSSVPIFNFFEYSCLMQSSDYISVSNLVPSNTFICNFPADLFRNWFVCSFIVFFPALR